jgi:hypothetical protein
MNDVHALSGAYAIDALDDIERARFEHHLGECPECQAEVASLREASALLAETASTPPPDALREKVLAGISTVRPLPPVVPEPAAPPAAPARRRFRPVALVAAAAAVIALAAGAVVWQPWDDATTQSPSISAVDQVLQAEDAEEYKREFPDGSTATLTRSKSLNKAVLVTDDMAPPPDGKVYELWLDHEGIGMVPAGVMPVEPDAVVLLEGDPATAIGAGITVEPGPDGSEEPTGETVALIPFKQA